MVSVGFDHPLDGNPDASITKRFGTSCVCWKGVSTEAVGSVPMRAQPTSWLAQRGVLNGFTLSPAGRLEHLGGGGGHVGAHRPFVVLQRHADPQHRDAPRVHDGRVDLTAVVGMVETLTEPLQPQYRRRIGGHRARVLRTEARRLQGERDVGAGLVAVAAQERRRPRRARHVPEADAGRARSGGSGR